MSELPTQYMAQEPADPDSTSEKLLNPELAQAQVVAQTIQRFQALNRVIHNIVDRQEQKRAWTKLDALATREYGKAWEVLRQPEVEVVPLVIGGKTKDELKQELTANGYKIGHWAEQMMDSPDFVTLPQPAPIIIICLTVRDLGFSTHATTAQMLGTKEKQFTDGITPMFGLELCPAEVGPQYCLQTPNQPRNDFVRVGMQPITVPGGNPSVFGVYRSGDGRWLDDNIAKPTHEWNADFQFLFRLPLLRSEPAEATHE